MCDRKIPLKLKSKLYCRTIRPAMLHDGECWPIKKLQVKKLLVVEMRMLSWISGHNLLDRVQNEDILDKVGVISIEDKLR